MINSYSMIAADSSDLIPLIAAKIGVNDFSGACELSWEQRKQLRRCGAFHSAAVRSACGAGAAAIPADRLAEAEIILLSRFGDQDTTGNFIDDLIDYGNTQGSPIKFAHSNHNTAAAYVARTLGAGGAIVTLVNFEHVFVNALTLAAAHLELGRERDVILIQVESLSALSCILMNGLKGLEPEKNSSLSAHEKVFCESGCLILSSVRDEHNICSLEIAQADGTDNDAYCLENSRLPEMCKLVGAIMRGKELSRCHVDGETELLIRKI
ncbi:MAG: beta-ketoacyl synthase chain length factor [Victivallales bacterium]|nr:beta-ketoacyl synthase chain length factor [Victivallales bacterium]